MPTLRTLTAAEMTAAYNSVFREAFPPEELKPLDSILAMTEGGFYRPCGLFDGDRALAYACLWTDEPYILIDYLCVPASARNGGHGSAMIRALLSAYPSDTVFIGEVEAPTGNPEADEMIYRRLGFYERSGAKMLRYDSALFGVHYKTIVWANSPVDEAEVLRRHAGLYKRWFTPEMYTRAIQIPLAPGERPFDRKVWDERPESEENL